MIKRYHCPQCGKKLWRTPLGFMQQPTVCSEECRGRIYRAAEGQFAIWGYTVARLKTLYFRVVKLLNILEYDVHKYGFEDFVIWLFTRHAKSRQELERVYSSLMEAGDARVERTFDR